MNLRSYFDRVVLVNLKRRPDRLTRVRKALSDYDWPFKRPEVFTAVDGAACPPPREWRHGAGAWGCTQSHLAVLEQALHDRVKNLLVLEDDVCFAEGFRNGVESFLRAVPDDWDGLMLGGQHIIEKNGWPEMIKPGVYRCLDCERTHGYAVRGRYLAMLCRRWRGGGKFNGDAHCDHIMGRDPDLQRTHKVYAPEFFLLGQERSLSDVTGAIVPRKFWNPPNPDLCLINLHVPRPVMESLLKHGIHIGYERDLISGLNQQLVKIFRSSKKHSTKTINLLRKWIISTQWEVCGDRGFIGAVWHPDATPQLVKAASLWPVHEVKANTVEAALRQMPCRLSNLQMR